MGIPLGAVVAGEKEASRGTRSKLKNESVTIFPGRCENAESEITVEHGCY